MALENEVNEYSRQFGIRATPVFKDADTAKDEVRRGISRPQTMVEMQRRYGVPDIPTETGEPVNNAPLADKPQPEVDPNDPSGGVGFVDSVKKGWQGLMLTWDFLANKLEKAVTGDTKDTEQILAASAQKYLGMKSDPRIAKAIETATESFDKEDGVVSGTYEGSKAMLGFFVDNPGAIVNFLGEQVPALGAAVAVRNPAAALPSGIARGLVTRGALSSIESTAVKSAIVRGTEVAAKGAAINSVAVVSGSLGSNYVEGLEKFGGDTEAAKDYATTKTLAEVPANAVAGAFMAFNPFASRFASPTLAATANVGTQAVIQGTGGAGGAYMAAKSVGEDAKFGELALEFFGESLTAPVDVIATRSEIKAERVKEARDKAMEGVTVGVDRLNQMVNTDRGLSVFAAIYQDATPEIKTKIDAVVENAGLTDKFQSALEDKKTVESGQKIVDQNQAFIGVVNRSLSAVSDDALADLKASNEKTAETTTKAPATTETKTESTAVRITDPAGKVYEGTMLANGMIEATMPDGSTFTVPPSFATKIEPIQAGETNASETGQKPKGRQSKRVRTDEQVQTDGQTGVVETAEQTGGTETSGGDSTVQGGGEAQVTVTTEKATKTATSKPRKGRRARGAATDLESTSKNIDDLTKMAQEKAARGESLTAEETSAIEQAIAEGKAAVSKARETAAKGEALANEALGTTTANSTATTEAPGATKAKRVSKKKQQGIVGDLLQANRELKQEEREANKETNKQNRKAARSDAALDILEEDVVAGRITAEEAKAKIAEAKKAKQINAGRAAQLTSKVEQAVRTREENKASEKAKGESGGSDALTSRISQELNRIEAEKQDADMRAKTKRPSRGAVKKEVLTEEIGAVNKYVNDSIVRVTEGISSDVSASFLEKSALALGSLAKQLETRASEIAPNTSIGIWAKSSLNNLARDVRAAEGLVKKAQSEQTGKSREQAQKAVDRIIDNARKVLGRGNETITRIENRDTATELDEAQFTPEEVVESGTKTGRPKGSKDVLSNFAGKPFAEFGLDEFTDTKDPEVFLSGGGLGFLSKDKWFRSLDAALRKASKNKDVELRQNILDSIKDSELQAYEAWKDGKSKRLNLLRQATKDKSIKQEQLKALLNDPDFVFSGYVFNDYPNLALFERPLEYLRQRNPDVDTNNPMYRAILRLGGGVADSSNVWFESIFTAISNRPDLEAQILSRLSNDEVARYKQWSERQDRAMDLAQRMRQRGAEYKRYIDIIDEYGADAEGVEISYEQLLGVIGDIERSGGDTTNLFSRGAGTGGGGMSVASVYAMVKQLTKGWTNAPNIEVVNAEIDLPQSIKDRLAKDIERNPDGVAQGYFDQETGTVYLFADNMFSGADVEFTLFHETYGHYGLRGILGDKLNAFLNRAYATSNRVREATKAWLDENRPDNAGKEWDAENRLLAIEEGLSNLNAQGQELGLFKQVLVMIRDFAESMGWDSVVEYLDNVSEVEVASVLADARQYAKDGNPFTFSTTGTALFLRAGHLSQANFDEFVLNNSVQDSGFGDSVYSGGVYFYRDANLGQGYLMRVNLGSAGLVPRRGNSKSINQHIEDAIDSGGSAGVLEAPQANAVLEIVEETKRLAYAARLEKLDDLAPILKKVASEYESRMESEMEVAENDGDVDAVSSYAEAISKAREIANWKISQVGDPVKYVVEIDDNVVADNFAQWDGKVSDGPKSVQKFFADRPYIKSVLKLAAEDPNFASNIRSSGNRTALDPNNPTFAWAYDALVEYKRANMFGNTRGNQSDVNAAKLEAASDMSEGGVKGSYHWETQRSKDEDPNLVVYDPKMIRIVKKEPSPKSPALYSRKQQSRPVEVVAKKGDKTHGLAVYDPILQEWTIFTNPNADIRTGKHNVQYAKKIDDVMNALKVVPGVQITSMKAYPGRTPASPQVMVATQQNQSAFKKMIQRKIDDLVIYTQNQYLPIKRYVDNLRANERLSDDANVWQKLILYHGRAGAKLDNFNNEYVKPITELAKAIAKAGGSLKEIDDYLYARHALVRNEILRQRNSKKDSGMSDAEANQILTDVQNKPYGMELEQIGRLVDAMAEAKPQLMFDAGLISQAQRDALAKMKHYVNLSGLDALEEQDIPNFGRRFNLRGSEIRAATGRTSRATNVLARTIADFEAKIIRAEKNRVAESVLKMIEENPDPNFAVVQPLKRKSVLDKNGNVAYVGDPMWDQKNGALVVKRNGQDVKIEFMDKSQNSFADAIGGLYNQGEMSWIIKAAMRWNHFASALVTVYAPDWVVVNGMRDMQTAFYNSRADFGNERAVKMFTETKNSWKGALKFLTGAGNQNDVYVKYYNELREAGGLTHFLNMDTVGDVSAQMEKAIAKVAKAQGASGILSKAGGMTVDGIGAVFRGLETFNKTIEAAPRLAAYKVLRENGFSKDQAAQYAKELTVNFNMKGKQQGISAAYLFFNPAVQGTERIYRAFKNPSTRQMAMKTAGGLMVLGFAATAYSLAAGGEDEDGVPKIKKQPEYKRHTSIVLPIPGAEETMLSIPLPYGWNFFYAAGVELANTVLMNKSTADAGLSAIKAFLGAYSVFGGDDSSTFFGWMGKNVTPTLGKPVVQWMMNENRFGSPIYKESPGFVANKPPASEQYFESTSYFSRFITRKIHEMAGGTQTLPAENKMFDINPALLDHLFRSYVPGLPSDAFKAMDVGYRKALGYEVPPKSMPLIGRLTSISPEGYDIGALRKLSEYVETRYSALKDMSDADQEKYRARYPNLSDMHGVVDEWRKFSMKEREAIKNARADKSIPEDVLIKAINESKARERKYAAQLVKRAVELGYDDKF